MLADVDPVAQYVGKGLVRYVAEDVNSLKNKLDYLYAFDDNELEFMGKR